MSTTTTGRLLLRRDQHLRAIRWDPKGQSFLCGDKRLSTGQLGGFIAHAICRGETEIRLSFLLRGPGREWRTSWSTGFTTGYLLSMLQFVAEHGWFWDAVEDGDDHKFDGARITPGIHWAQVEQLRQQAQSLSSLVGAHAVEGGNASMAAEFADNAHRLTVQADRLLPLDVPPRQGA